MRELWTCHLGTVEYRAAAALQEELRGARDRGRAARPAAAARAPAGLHARPPLRARRPAVRRGVLARARDRRRAHPARRQADLPRAGPARRLPDHARARRRPPTCARWRRRSSPRSARRGSRARGRDHEGPEYTGVWVEDRKIASIGVHLSRGVSAHGFAINVDNDVEPFHQVIACGLPGVRMTSVALETRARRAPRRASAGATAYAFAAGARAAPADRHAGGGSGSAARAGTLLREHRTAAPPRDALAREPRRDGRHEGAGHGHAAVPRPQAGVVQGAAAGRPALPRADRS